MKEIRFGERLRDLRQEKNIGQVELATKIGVSKGIISLWEQGKREPTLSSLVAIDDFFNVTIDYLIGREI